MWPWKSTPRTEHPIRLKRFQEELAKADWRNRRAEAMNIAFGALNDLVHHEIDFYYSARKGQRRFSIGTRLIAVTLGTGGTLAPLLAGADSRLAWLTAWGYPLLALAAAVLVVNRLFGATGGHIRYVTAQLQLEQLLTSFRLDWAQWQADTSDDPNSTENRKAAFTLLRKFSDEAYKIILDETNVWGKSVSEALHEYTQQLGARKMAQGSIKGRGSDDAGH